MAEQAARVFSAAERGQLKLLVSSMTVAETIWTLESYYGYGRAEISSTLLAFLFSDGIVAEEKSVLVEAVEAYRDKNVDFIDAYLAAHANQMGTPTMITFDRKHFNRLAVKVIDPGSSSEFK